MATIIDIHSHILPGLDDGSKDMANSIAMMKIAYENGIRDIILTPHFKPGRHNASANTINKTIENLQELCLARGIKIRLFKGSEIMYYSGAGEALLSGLANTLAGSRYVLVEFSPGDTFERIRSGLYDLQSAGFMPIVAHVERYENLCDNPKRVEELIGMGCYIQVNAGSVMGDFGKTTKKNVKNLLKQHLVHFIASDAHDTEKRSPAMLECYKYIIKKYGERYEQELFSINPMKILKNEVI